MMMRTEVAQAPTLEKRLRIIELELDYMARYTRLSSRALVILTREHELIRDFRKLDAEYDEWKAGLKDLDLEPIEGEPPTPRPGE